MRRLDHLVRRQVVAAVALAVVAHGCGSSVQDEAGSPRFESRAEIHAAVDDALDIASIEVIENPDGPTSGTAPIELLTFQVDSLVSELEAGGGYLGEEIDDLVGSPGGLPFSYLIAGWLSNHTTPIATAAFDLTGDQDWAHAPDIVYPSAVLTLFVADAVAHADQAPPDAAGTSINALPVRYQMGNVCSALSGWVESTLTSLFELLKVQIDEDGDFWDWLGEAWNTAVELFEFVLGGLVELLTAPVVALITDALVVIGTLSQLTGLLKPWNVSVVPDQATTSFAAGDEPDIENGFTATVDAGVAFTWPPTLVDCAKVAGFDLPDPGNAAGSPITWKVKGLPPLGSITGQDGQIDVDDEARLDFVTGRDHPKATEPRSGAVSVRVVVKADQLIELKKLLASLITNQLPSEPFGGFVASFLAPITDAVFDKLAELTWVSGTGKANVVFHVTTTTTTTTTTTLPSSVDACVVGGWESQTFDITTVVENDPVADSVATGGGGVLVDVASDGSIRWDFNQAKPFVNEFVTSDGLFSVTTEYFTVGTAQGTLVTSSGGRWEVTIDTSAMQSSSVVEGGPPTQMEAPVFHTSVLGISGSYTCDDDTLVFEYTGAQSVRGTLTRR